jgi:hypothetical protein
VLRDLGPASTGTGEGSEITPAGAAFAKALMAKGKGAVGAVTQLRVQTDRLLRQG